MRSSHIAAHADAALLLLQVVGCGRRASVSVVAAANFAGCQKRLQPWPVRVERKGFPLPSSLCYSLTLLSTIRSLLYVCFFAFALALF